MMNKIMHKSWAMKFCGSLIGLFLGVMAVSMPASAKTKQHRWVGDVPIMNGWTIEPELGFAFDSPNGRIVMVFAESKSATAAIMQFYSNALAQLGWTGGNGIWQRGPEKLMISEVETARGTLWRLMLQPAQ